MKDKIIEFQEKYNCENCKKGGVCEYEDFIENETMSPKLVDFIIKTDKKSENKCKFFKHKIFDND